jgi:NAD(P)-dependent dehydrogenase (short-subunit alcohol dehydrogenase family)
MGVLDGKVAVITGGTSGIGARTAEVFAAEGVRCPVSARQRTVSAKVSRRGRGSSSLRPLLSSRSPRTRGTERPGPQERRSRGSPAPGVGTAQFIGGPSQ